MNIGPTGIDATSKVEKMPPSMAKIDATTGIFAGVTRVS